MGTVTVNAEGQLSSIDGGTDSRELGLDLACDRVATNLQLNPQRKKVSYKSGNRLPRSITPQMACARP
jgi:hypothetical protein